MDLVQYLFIYQIIFLWSLLLGVKSQSLNQQTRYRRQLRECDPRSNEGCEQFLMNDYPSPLSDDHKCEDYILRERGNEFHIKRILSEDPWLEERTMGRLKISYDNFFYVKGLAPEQEFLLCAIPKTGVTRLKMLIMRITHLHGHVHGGAAYKQVPYKFAQSFSKSEKETILFNPNITRIKTVRNPYIRAISGYQDKILSNNWKRNGKFVGWNMEFTEIPTFDEWIAQLYKNYKLNKRIDDHFATQHERCWENLGLKFDYILKVERMKNWFPCFVQKLNLWQYVMRGWPGEDNCYLSTPDVPCNGPEQTDQGNLVYNTSIQGLNHNHDAFKVIKEFYKNETTAKLVTEIFLDDIVQYDYPFWNEMTWDKYKDTNYIFS